MQPSAEARSTLRRWLVVTILLFLLAVGALVFAVDRYMAAVDPQTPTLRIVDDATCGALHFKANPAHAGTRDLLDGATRQLVGAAAKRAERLSVLSRILLPRVQSQVLPADLTVTARSAGRLAPPTLAAAVNFRGYPRLMCQIVNAVFRKSTATGDAGSRDYAGSRMIGEFPTICLKQGTLLLTSDPTTMQSLLDGLPAVLPAEPTPVTTAPGEIGPTLRAALEEMNPADDAVGVYDNHDDNLAPVLQHLMYVPEADAQAFSAACARLSAGVAVESADRMTLSVDLTPTGRASASQLQALTGDLLRKIAVHAKEGGLTISFRTTATATAAHADVTLSGLQGALSSLQNLMVEVGIVETPAPAP